MKNSIQTALAALLFTSLTHAQQVPKQESIQGSGQATIEPAAARQGLSPAMRAALPSRLTGGAVVVSGACPIEGVFALSVRSVDSTSEGKRDALLRLQAQVALAEFLGVGVRSKTERDLEQTSRATAEGQATTIIETFRSSAGSEVATVLNGIELADVVTSGESTFVVFALTRKSVERAVTLRSLTQLGAPPESGQGAPVPAAHGTRSAGILSMGFAIIYDGDLEEAMSAAMDNAKQQAIEQARGALVISRTSWNQIDDQVSQKGKSFVLSIGSVQGIQTISQSVDRDAGVVKITIRADVGPADFQECLAEYMSSAGAPRFYVDWASSANAKELTPLQPALVGALNSMGAHVTDSLKDADYIVVSSAEFVDTRHPINRRTVTTLQPMVEIKSLHTNEVLASPQTEHPVSSNVSEAAFRRKDCLELYQRAIAESIGAEFGRLANQYERNGRPITATVRCPKGLDLGVLGTDVAERLRSMAGMSDVTPTWEASKITIRCRSIFTPADLDSGLRDALKSALWEDSGSHPGFRFRSSASTHATLELDILPVD